MITEKAVNDAYDMLQAAKADLYGAVGARFDAETGLEVKKNELVNAGAIAGKNEAEREAKASQLLVAESASLLKAEVAERYARFLFDRARLEVDRVHALLRLEGYAAVWNDTNEVVADQVGTDMMDEHRRARERFASSRS